jgi:hypothetical protein
MICDHCGSSNLMIGVDVAKCKDCKRKTFIERVVRFFQM